MTAETPPSPLPVWKQLPGGAWREGRSFYNRLRKAGGEQRLPWTQHGHQTAQGSHIRVHVHRSASSGGPAFQPRPDRGASERSSGPSRGHSTLSGQLRVLGTCTHTLRGTRMCTHEPTQKHTGTHIQGRTQRHTHAQPGIHIETHRHAQPQRTHRHTHAQAHAGTHMCT